ncbi:hypothetical protein AB0392_32240 [Nonomuraea angiospora]|uniref:hypothetical protein n=1 Tax=Nonomuraea angiospora TaxID=46172 RepID=UPI00344D979D
MILEADRGNHINSHAAPDATLGTPGGFCHLMRSENNPDLTYHERIVTLGGTPGDPQAGTRDESIVTWRALCVDVCPPLDGAGVFDCLGCSVRHQPGTLSDAQQHVTSCNGGAA